MDLVVSPTIVGFNTQSNGHGAVLTPGQLIDALVLQLLDATTVRLSVAGNIVDVKTQVALEPGSAVRLAVRGHGAETRLVIVGQGLPSQIANTPPSPKNNPPAQQQPQRGNTQQLPATLPQIVSASTDEAGHSTPLVHAPDAPPVVPKQAVRDADPAVALANATRSAAARQTSLAPVFAEAAAALEAPGIPQPVKEAAQLLLAMRAPFEQEVSAEIVQKAVSRAGLFLEAKLGAVVRTQAAPNATPSNVAAAITLATTPDIKAVLFTLREALKVWLDPLQTPLRTAGSSPSAPSLPDHEATASSNGSVAAPPTQADEMVALAKSLVGELKVPPPPYRNAPTQGQQPAPAAVASDAPAQLIGHALLEEATGAIARTTLMQAASLPGAPSAVAEHADSGATHWNLEIPFALPQGQTAIAHFEISRDEHKAAAAERRPPGWRVNFSVDVEPMGPVHAQVALTGHRAAVRLWAERSTTAGALRQSVGDLNAALKQAALEPSEIVVRDGAPPRPLKPGAGRFLDRAS